MIYEITMDGESECATFIYTEHKSETGTKEKGGVMKYKTVVGKYNPRAKKMAEEVERVANEYAEKGWKLQTVAVTLSAKAILVFEVSDAKQ